jgi:hypothetical protein
VAAVTVAAIKSPASWHSRAAHNHTDHPIRHDIAATAARQVADHNDSSFPRERRLRLLSVTGFPVGLRPRLAEFTAPRQHMGVAKVLAMPAALDPVGGMSAHFLVSRRCINMQADGLLIAACLISSAASDESAAAAPDSRIAGNTHARRRR